MAPHAIDFVCESVHEEMEAAKPYLSMTTAQTSPEFIESWDINAIMDPIARDITPMWTAVLNAATESKICHAKADADSEPQDSRHTTRNIISSQVHYRRSCISAKVQIGLGLMAWSTGASRNLINVLHKAGLSRSYGSINDVLGSLQKFSLAEAALISRGPHALAYDNVNLSAVDPEQLLERTMSKVKTGTQTLIYGPLGAKPEHLLLQPIIDNLAKSPRLKLGDLRPTQTSATEYLFQTAVSVSKILFKYFPAPEFENLISDPALQHRPRRPLPKGHKTRFYPLSITTIEEATINGNLHVHDNIYIDQLHHTPDSEFLNKYAIPCLNDQLTNARIRGTQILRAKDINPWERREVFQLAFGTFHLVMNLIWALLHTHRGTSAAHGSLSYYFTLLEKARLGNDRPSYYTLLSALTQILEGLILNAWHSECGYSTLEEFAANNPTTDDILRIARTIVDKYATPTCPVSPVEMPSKPRKSSGKNNTANERHGDETRPSDNVDCVYSNTILLTRDLLYVIEITKAMSAGDFGRIEDILPQIACIFRGAGSNNYSMEVLHFLFNIKHVWPEEFA
ncbi:hypothetical protein BDN70DRAFT_794191 [Pholiota conissans]|uniref:DUF6589 domain-containing protein n=1 Tax=Pholiota conissans TaxID=109636 RepID=A0A9P5ZFI4_9AGAR|nr:hypothetical protein BDN70DRAFT_794191 [Pholiota conissans]